MPEGASNCAPVESGEGNVYTHRTPLPRVHLDYTTQGLLWWSTQSARSDYVLADFR
jgi:hypothetical protein